MKDPNACSYPLERLCIYGCADGCIKHKPPKVRTEQTLEDEAWQELEDKLKEQKNGKE